MRAATSSDTSGVGAYEAGGEDHAGSDRGPGERVQVGQDVLEFSSMLMDRRLAPDSIQLAARFHGERRASSTARMVGRRARWRRHEPTNRLIDDERGKHEQRHPIGLGGEHLDAPETVGWSPFAGRRASPTAISDSPIAAASVSMCAASERSASGGEDPADDLDDHEAEDQRERDRQPAGVGLAAVRVPHVRAVPGVGEARARCVMLVYTLASGSAQTFLIWRRCILPLP